jgi:hypothetical protein
MIIIIVSIQIENIGVKIEIDSVISHLPLHHPLTYYRSIDTS